MCCLADLRPLSNGVLAWAGSEVNVAVPEEAVDPGRGTRRVARAAEALRGQGDARGRINTRNRALPASKVGDGLQQRLRRLGSLIVTDHGDTPGIPVEATNVSSLYGLVEPAVAALVDGAVLIHQRVVSDIAPSQVLRMVLVRGAHLRGCLRAGVVIGARGVVQRNGLNAVVIVSTLASDALIRAPTGARDHARHAVGLGGRLNDLALLGVAVHEDSFQAVDVAIGGKLFGLSDGGDVADVEGGVVKRGVLDGGFGELFVEV